MSIVTRPAVASDVAAVAKLLLDVWPDEKAAQSDILASLTDVAHASFVAVAVTNDDPQRIVGFIDCFEVYPAGAAAAAAGAARSLERWEIDLLAVHPDFQRRGAGRSLVRAGLQEGRSRGLWAARTVVRLGNDACQHVLAQCGFKPRKQIYGLLVCSDLSVPAASQPGFEAALVKVQTCLYHGFWVEDPVSLDTLEHARASLLNIQDPRAICGALYPLETGHQDIPNAAGYLCAGKFCCWESEGKPLGEGISGTSLE